MINEPIRRHTAMQPISREHHHSLLFCWKIRTGITKSVDPARMIKYADWFYRTYIIPHFEEEEKYIFPILGSDSELVKRALTEHRKIKRLFEKRNDSLTSLTIIEETLENHIRFEERVLFNKIQEVASEEDLSMVNAMHTDKGSGQEWRDPFW